MSRRRACAAGEPTTPRRTANNRNGGPISSSPQSLPPANVDQSDFHASVSWPREYLVATRPLHSGRCTLRRLVCEQRAWSVQPVYSVQPEALDRLVSAIGRVGIGTVVSLSAAMGERSTITVPSNSSGGLAWLPLFTPSIDYLSKPTSPCYRALLCVARAPVIRQSSGIDQTHVSRETRRIPAAYTRQRPVRRASQRIQANRSAKHEQDPRSVKRVSLLRRHQSHPQRPFASANAGPDDPSHFIEYTFTQRENLHVVKSVLADLLRRCIDFRGRTGPLHQHELTTIPKQGSSQGNQLAEGTHRTRRHLIQWSIQSRVFGARAHNLNVRQGQFLDLLRQPCDPTLHGFDQHELSIWTRDRQDDPRKAGPAPDVADSTGANQWRQDRAVQDVTRPEAGQFQRTDQPTLFTLRGKVRREASGDIDPIAEKLDRRRWLTLEELGHCPVVS